MIEMRLRYYAMAGGDISLVCIIEDTLEPPQYVYWYHNDKIINYDTQRTRVSFDLGKNNRKTSSRLVIASVEKSDSGNYTCSTTNAEPSTISVFVSEGDKTLHLHDCGQSIRLSSVWLLLAALFTKAAL